MRLARVVAAGVLAVLPWSAASSSAPLVEFGWAPASTTVPPGATEAIVDLFASQSGGADAAFFTLGIAVLGNVAGIDLVAFGPQVSKADSFFGWLDDELVLTLASAPAPPGSFGTDVAVLIATFRLRIDPGLGTMGGASLVDLTDTAGPPALASDGVTVIASDLGPTHGIAVPEPTHPGAAALLALAAVGSWLHQETVNRRGT